MASNEPDNTDIRVQRSDVAALAVEVGELGAAVSDLHGLIVEALRASNAANENATTATEHMRNTPTRDEVATTRARLLRQVYGLTGLSIALALVIAAGGFTAANAYVDQQRQFRQVQYENCLNRNAQVQASLDETARSRAFFAAVIDVQRRAAARGDKTAQELLRVLTSGPTPSGPAMEIATVDCQRLLDD